jgi:hypothetical protein
MAVLLLWSAQARAKDAAGPKGAQPGAQQAAQGAQPQVQEPARPRRRQNPATKRVTHAERQAAADRAKALRAKRARQGAGGARPTEPKAAKVAEGTK